MWPGGFISLDNSSKLYSSTFFQKVSASLPFDEFDTVTDLTQIDITSFRTSTRRVGFGDPYLRALCDRVSDLELGFDRFVARKKNTCESKKYTWTAEIESPEKEQKYKWTAEIKDGRMEKMGLEKRYKWTAQIKGKGEFERTYTVKVSSGGGGESEKETKKKKCEKMKGKSGVSAGLTIEIEESCDNGGIVLRQVFGKRVEKKKGKRKELSRQDAAALIQMSFRAYLI